ncbi:MAG: hypothetical protein ACRD3W_28755, partial [Terriglobales bacterium]
MSVEEPVIMKISSGRKLLSCMGILALLSSISLRGADAAAASAGYSGNGNAPTQDQINYAIQVAQQLSGTSVTTAAVHSGTGSHPVNQTPAPKLFTQPFTLDPLFFGDVTSRYTNFPSGHQFVVGNTEIKSDPVLSTAGFLAQGIRMQGLTTFAYDWRNASGNFIYVIIGNSQGNPTLHVGDYLQYTTIKNLPGG